ncbi:hypothetical Protein YC6258_00503 [Gynuella sunshinyii YC6258]|uniref:Uncharacterized protein n=1 Tax=Gynuella sunshinyii YC6258 TaxID=1445510 RepID=A0A0C5VGN3_9GAMM|nr:hypothetical Protein YC6258_00503 [Gynuella sunshinyii YC6258]
MKRSQPDLCHFSNLLSEPFSDYICKYDNNYFADDDQMTDRDMINIRLCF